MMADPGGVDRYPNTDPDPTINEKTGSDRQEKTGFGSEPRKHSDPQHCYIKSTDHRSTRQEQLEKNIIKSNILNSFFTTYMTKRLT